MLAWDLGYEWEMINAEEIAANEGKIPEIIMLDYNQTIGKQKPKPGVNIKPLIGVEKK
jgi:hypothetical protein